MSKTLACRPTAARQLIHCGHTVFNLTMAAGEIEQGHESKKISLFSLDQRRVDFEPGHSYYCSTTKPTTHTVHTWQSACSVRHGTLHVAEKQWRLQNQTGELGKRKCAWSFVEPGDKWCTVSSRMCSSFMNPSIFSVNRLFFLAFERVVVECTDYGDTERLDKPRVSRCPQPSRKNLCDNTL